METDDLLTRLRPAFQPIVELGTGMIFGYESLIRGPYRSAWHLPHAIFQRMAQEDRRAELEWTCRRLGVSCGAERLPRQSVLFLNVDTTVQPLDLLLPRRFEEEPETLALEISEQHPILDNQELLAGVRRWRDRGHRVVLDDYGTGYAAAAAVLALRPDIIKLDIQLIRGIDRDAQRQTLVASIREYTEDLGIMLVAEGVETANECETVSRLGVDFGQGFWLGRPTIRLKRSLAHHPPLVPASPFLLSVNQGSTGTVLPFYQTALAKSPVPSYLVDRHRRILAWNDAACRALGYKSSDIVMSRCYDSIKHRDASGRMMCATACPLVQAMVFRQVTGPASATVQRADGTSMAVHVKATPLWDPARRRAIGAIEEFWPSAGVASESAGQKVQNAEE